MHAERARGLRQVFTFGVNDPSDPGPQVLLPERGGELRLVQTFSPPTEALVGLDVFLGVVPGVRQAQAWLTLFDEKRQVLREVPFSTASGPGWVRVSFEPIPPRAGRRLAFGLSVEGRSAGWIGVRTSAVTGYCGGSLLVDGVAQPLCLLFRTVHPARGDLRELLSLLELVRLPFFLAVALLALAGFGRLRHRVLVPLVALCSLYTAFGFMAFSPIDEEAHFDYVNAIVEEGRLPAVHERYATGPLARLSGELGNPEWSAYLWFRDRYEAVHPPLYYLTGAALAAVLRVFTESIAVRFYSLRLLGVACLTMAACVTVRAYEFLAARGLIPRDDRLFFATASLFFLSPGFQTSLIPITNDQTTVPLMALLTYYLVRLHTQREVTPANGGFLGLVVGLLILTKFTTLFTVPFVAVFLLHRRSFRALGACLGVSAALVLPLIAFNLDTYGALSGLREHLAVVSKSLPVHVIGLREILITSEEFVRTYLLGVDREFPFDQKGLLVAALARFWEITVLAVPGLYLWRRCSRAGHRAAGGGREASRAELEHGLFFLALILLNYISLVLGAVVNSVNVIFTRFTYLNVLAAVLCLHIAIRRARDMGAAGWALVVRRTGRQGLASPDDGDQPAGPA